MANHCWTRRQLLSTLSAAAAAAPFLRPRLAQAAPSSPVSIGVCRSYGPEMVTVLNRMFDELGGLGRLVSGKTVAIKLNLTGGAFQRLGHVPQGKSTWTNPDLTIAMIHMLQKAGATRVRLLESVWSSGDALEEFMLQAGWEPLDMERAGRKVEFENTNFLGSAKKYSRLKVPNGGHLFPAYDLNHSYEDCDVFMTLAKLKEHATAGITLAMKNSFGITPCTIYGEGAGEDEPTVLPVGGRGSVFHRGIKAPSRSAPQELHPDTPREGGYRVPRAVADLVAARPIHLSVIDGIETMAVGEGPWIPGAFHLKPGILIAGLNPVCADAVAMSVMGFDPMADRGTAPFETSDNTLRLGEEVGIGTRDLRQIEVIGPRIEEVRMDFRAERAKRPQPPPRRRRG